jgi:hypothetical protein
MKKPFVVLLATLTVLLCSPVSSGYATRLCDWPACISDPNCIGYCFPPTTIPTTMPTTIPTTSSTTSIVSTTTTSEDPTTTTTSIAACTSLNEGFEEATFPPADWSSQDVLGACVWQRSISNSHTGTAGAFINAPAPNSPNGLLTPRLNYPLAGDEDWLITPKISISPGYELTFWAMPSQPYVAALDIRVSTTDTAGASFTDSLDIIQISTLTAIWQQYSYSLSSYEGQNIYIAFKYTAAQPAGPSSALREEHNIYGPVEITGCIGSGIYLDDVQVSTPSSTTTTSIEETTTTTSMEPTTSQPSTSTTIAAEYAVPELIYYKFNNTGGDTVTNAASAPVGTNPAPVLNQTMGGSGQSGSALIGTGGSSSTDYVNTGWATSLTSGGWTISFWIKDMPATPSTTYYIFGDASASAFRCFMGGVAGNGNLILRATGLTDVPVTDVYAAQPAVIHFVYDATAPEIRVYVNGQLKNTVAQGLIDISGTAFKVGGYSSSNSLPVGSLMDEFRVYSRALSAEEITGTWNKDLDNTTLTTTTTTEPTTSSTTSIEPTTTTTSVEPTTTTSIEPSTSTTSVEVTTTTTSIEPTTTTTTEVISTTTVPGCEQVRVYYRDADSDTYGNPAVSIVACEAPEGYVDNSTGFDCDDTDAAVHPGAAEVCNGIDDDCNGLVDDNDTCDTDMCSVTVFPRRISKLFSQMMPNAIPFAIIASKGSGVEFQRPISIDWGTQFIDDWGRVTIGKRGIFGFLYLSYDRLEPGDHEVTVRFGPGDTVCAGKITVW